jgi:hypothetical protein
MTIWHSAIENDPKANIEVQLWRLCVEWFSQPVSIFWQAFPEATTETMKDL